MADANGLSGWKLGVGVSGYYILGGGISYELVYDEDGDVGVGMGFSFGLGLGVGGGPSLRYTNDPNPVPSTGAQSKFGLQAALAVAVGPVGVTGSHDFPLEVNDMGQISGVSVGSLDASVGPGRFDEPAVGGAVGIGGGSTVHLFNLHKLQQGIMDFFNNTGDSAGSWARGLVNKGRGMLRDWLEELNNWQRTVN